MIQVEESIEDGCSLHQRGDFRVAADLYCVKDIHCSSKKYCTEIYGIMHTCEIAAECRVAQEFLDSAYREGDLSRRCS